MIGGDWQFGFGDGVLSILLIAAIAFKITPSLPILFTFLITLIGLWCWFLYREKRVWHERGIPGPPTNIFFGHSMAIYKSGGVIGFDQENFKKYGKTYGSFMFGRPFLNTMDMDLLRRVYIKDFSHFTNRFNIVEQGNKEMVERSLVRNAISIIRDDDWRRVRNTVTPAFTTGKLKKLLPTICESTRSMGDYLEKEFITGGKDIPLKDVFGRFVMDVIGRAGFSLDFGTFSEDESESMMLQQAKKVFKPGRNLYFLIGLSFCPMVRHLLERLFNYDLYQSAANQFFEHFMSDLYDQRKVDPQAKEKYTDIFQLLMNAVEENEAESMIANGKAAATVAEDADAEFIHREIWAKPAQNRHLTKMELFAQSFILLVAGFDTTSSVLHFAIYLLATHPDVQEKLRQEILDVLGDEEEVTYEHLRRMQFLYAVIQETLRMFPPAPTMNRECGEDLDLNGIQLRAGDIIALPIYAIQHSEDFYPEPEKFMPERFLPEEKANRDQLSFVAFGLGPRNCIGMRLAEFQMQVALALLIRRFRFRSGPKTEKFPPKINSVFMLQPVEPLFAMAEKI